MEVRTQEAATEQDRFNLAKWAEARGFEKRHVLALSGHEAKALSEAARTHLAACKRRDAAASDADAKAEAVLPFLEKLRAIKAAAQ